MPDKDLDTLSPFELKNELIAIASSHADRVMLNAGRGNPNFLAIQPRHAFLRLGDFALLEAERSYAYLHYDFGGLPEKRGIAERFNTYVQMHRESIGVDFLRASASFVEDHMGIDKESFMFEMVASFLGCHYPDPPRMQPIAEQMVNHYLVRILSGNQHKSHDFDVFATEGGTAAMTYIFQTLSTNGLIKKKDKIALITPIFSPYLEIPRLPKYDLEVVDIRADENQGWQVPNAEIQKLADPSIKVLCLVNPSNPPSVKMSDDVLDKLADLVENQRRDLMIVTDDVYGTFADQFTSLFVRCPFNTLCVYSFSKYFGATGWRLGTIALRHDNVFDEALQHLPASEQQILNQRYESLTPDPSALRFINRLVADSRAVALNHTAGLSLPQQVQMALFALAGLLDDHQEYQWSAKRLIQRRYELLYQALGCQPPVNGNAVDYYTLLDLEVAADLLYNKDFSQWLLEQNIGTKFLFRLAKETGVVLLPGKGFEDAHPSARVSLANLRECDYKSIGHFTRQVLDEYYETFQVQKK